METNKNNGKSGIDPQPDHGNDSEKGHKKPGEIITRPGGSHASMV